MTGCSFDRPVRSPPPVLDSIVAGVLALALAAAPLRAQCPDGTPPPCRGVRAAPPPLPTVAVLVFESRSRDSNDVYLAEGIADELTTRLGRLGRLTVRSESAARTFRAGVQPAQAIGRALNVTYLVTGTVRRGGARVRISAELARAATGERIWGEQYDRSADEVLRMEDDVAEAIATAIAGRLAPAERARISRDPSASPAAYDHYLKGLFQLRHRSEEAMNVAWTEFSAAVALDPAFVDARAQLGAVGNIAGFLGLTVAGMPPESILARGERETQTALRLDSTSAQAWVNLSTLRAGKYPTTYAGVREAADRALQLDSLGDQICYVVGNHYAHLGDVPRALVLFRRAHEADPLNGTTLVALIYAAWFLGKRAEALTAMDTLVSLATTARDALGLRALLRLAAGDTVGARLDLQAAAPLHTAPDTEERVARILLGDTVGVGAFVESARTQFDRTRDIYLYGMPLAAVLAATGDRAAALDVLERGRPHDILSGFFIGHDPSLAALAAEPRYRALLAEMAPPPSSR